MEPMGTVSWSPPQIETKETGWNHDLLMGIKRFYNSEAYKNAKANIVKKRASSELNNAYKFEYYKEFNNLVRPHLKTCPDFDFVVGRDETGSYGKVRCTSDKCVKKIVPKKANADPVEIILEAFIQHFVYDYSNSATVEATICKHDEPKKYSMVMPILDFSLANAMSRKTDEKEIVYAILQVAHHLFVINERMKQDNMSFTHRDLNTKNIMCKDTGVRTKIQLDIDGIKIEFPTQYKWKIIDFGMSCVKTPSTVFTTGYRNFWQDREKMACLPNRDLAVLFYDIMLRKRKYPELFQKILKKFFRNEVAQNTTNFNTAIANDHLLFAGYKYDTTGKELKWSYWHYKNYKQIEPKAVFEWARDELRNRGLTIIT